MTTVEIARMVIRLVGDGAAYTKMLNQAEQTTVKYVKSVQSQVAKATTALAGLGAAIAGPIGIGTKKSIDSFLDFNHAMTESQSIMGNLTDDQMARMRDVALNMATTWSKSATDMARAYYYLASAGFNVEQSIAALPAVERFAVAGAFDMAEATSYASDTLKAMGMDSQDAAENLSQIVRVSDVIVKANTLANATTRQFALSLTRDAGAALRIVNKDIEEGVAVLAAFADQGIKAELAGNSLGRAIRLLIGSAHKAGDAHKALGFEVYDAQGKMRPFADIIQNLEEILGPMSDRLRGATLKALGFEVRMQQAILPLIGMSNKIRGFEKELRAAGGTTTDVANKQMKSFHNQLLRMWNTITVLGIEIGETFAPGIGFLADVVGSAVAAFRSLDPAIKSTIIETVILVGAVFGLTGAVLILGKVFNLMFGGVGILLGAAVVGLTAFAITLSSVVAAFGGFGAVIDSVKKKLSELWEWAQPIREAFLSLAQTVVTVMTDIGSALVLYVQSLEEPVKATFASIFEFLGAEGIKTWEDMRDVIRDVVYFIEYSLLHINKVSDAAWIGVKLGAIKTINAIIYGFGKLSSTGWKGITKAWQLFLKGLYFSTFGVFEGIWKIMSGKVKGKEKTESLWKSIQEGLKDIQFTPEGGLEIKSLKDLEKQIQEEFDDAKDAITEDFLNFKDMRLEDIQFWTDVKFDLDMFDAVADSLRDVDKAAGDVRAKGPFFDHSLLLEEEDALKKMSHAVERIDHVLAGSAEAAYRMQEARLRLRETDPTIKLTKDDKGDAKAAHTQREKQIELLKKIKEEIKAKAAAGVDIEDVDLGEF